MLTPLPQPHSGAAEFWVARQVDMTSGRKHIENERWVVDRRHFVGLRYSPERRAQAPVANVLDIGEVAGQRSEVDTEYYVESDQTKKSSAGNRPKDRL
jgi:hypothetical protein